MNKLVLVLCSIVLAASTLVGTSYATHNRRVFVEQLRGKNEVPPVETPARGVAIFVINPDETEIRYRLLNSFLPNAVGAHIHLAPEGVNGPIVVTLYSAPPGQGTMHGTLSSGFITADDLEGSLAGMPLSALLAAMRSGNAYVNVHTNDGIDPANTGPGDFPGGEMRGQID